MMATVRITKIFDFEMAHALWGYEGPCKNVHGHSYKLFITVSGKIKKGSSNSKDSMITDFSQLKKIAVDSIISNFDHALVLDKNMPGDLKSAAEKMSDKIIYLDGMPTCECLVVLFAGILIDKFPPGVELHHLLLQETSTSLAEWYRDENR